MNNIQNIDLDQEYFQRKLGSEATAVLLDIIQVLKNLDRRLKNIENYIKSELEE